jgi:hypothetical protein
MDKKRNRYCRFLEQESMQTTLPEVAALVAALLLVPVIVLQALLAAAFPFGHAAWGGQYRVLPVKLRWGSAAATVVLGAAIWIVLARAGVIASARQSVVVRAATWLFAGVFLLNTIGNLASSSATERKVMAPITLLLAACFLIVALSR